MDLEKLLTDAGVDVAAARAKVAAVAESFPEDKGGIPDITLDRIMDEFIPGDTGRKLIRGQFRALMNPPKPKKGAKDAAA